jgi:hypothetical protein
VKTDDLDRLRDIAPHRHGTPALYDAAEREALIATVLAEDPAGGPRRTRRPARASAFRLTVLAAAGVVAAAAVAVLATGGEPGLASHGHLAARPHRPGAQQAQTTAYIMRRARAAMAGEHGTLRVTTVTRVGVWRYVEDLGSGANRSTYSRTLGGPIQADYSSTARGPSATFTVVYYPVRAWWTDKGFVPGPSSSFSARMMRQQMDAGILMKVGDGTVAGQRAIHLRYTKGREIRTHGHTYFQYRYHGHAYISDGPVDLWVNAATFLPIRESTSKETDYITWSRQAPTAAQLTAVPPAGFTHRDGPPRSLLKVTGRGVG